MGDYVVATWGPWDDPLQRQFFDERMAGGHLDVIVVGNEIAGLYEVEPGEREVFIVNLELMPAFQRRGLGTKILQHTMAEAAARKMPVVLHVLQVNPARRLYERLGFVEFERTATHHHMRWTPTGAGRGA